MMRTSWCGQVAAPNASRSSAFARKVGARPSAPPIRKTAAGRSLPRHFASRAARLALLRFSPWASSNTTAAPCGMMLASAIDSSSMRLPASSARLSLISTISTSRTPRLRPVCAARLRKRSESSVSGPCFRRPTAATTIRILPLRLSVWALAVCTSGRPHFFQAIKSAHFRPEHVDDHIAGVDQHPVALPHALDANAGHAGGLEILDHMVGDRADMALRPAGGHDHVIAYRGFAGEIDGDAVLGFHVFQTREDDAECLLGTGAQRPRLGDGFGHATRRPRECRFAQRLFPFTFVALAPAYAGDVVKIAILLASFHSWSSSLCRRGPKFPRACAWRVAQWR